LALARWAVLEKTMEGTLWSIYHRSPPRFELTRVLLISALLHLLVAGSAVIFPSLIPRRTVQIPFYSVDLVSLDQAGLKGSSGGAGSGKKTVDSLPSSSRQNLSIPVMPVERLRTQLQPTEDAPLKKLAANPDVDKTVKTTPPPLEKALDKMTARTRQSPEATTATTQSATGTPTEPKKSPGASSTQGQREPTAKPGGGGAEAGKAGPSSQPGPQAGSQAGSQAGDGSTDAGQISLARRLYYTEVWNVIRREWVLDTNRLKGQRLEAVVILVVRRDGKILNYRFEKKSGNALLDESAERAVRKVDTLPPFPKIFNPSQEEIGIRFRPEDL
jgi:colicin import membrane protein